MSRFNALALGLSLLLVPAASAFAEGEGSFQPQVVASPASGRAVDGGVGGSFAYSLGEGGQQAASPAQASVGAARNAAIAAGAFVFNSGLNG
jgi:hypothetical protein